MSDLFIILCYLAVIFAVCAFADVIVKIVWRKQNRVSRFLEKIMCIPEEETEGNEHV